MKLECLFFSVPLKHAWVLADIFWVMCEFLMLTHISFQQQHVEFVSVFYYISGSTSAKPAF